MRLVLASASPRRAELLRAAGYVFETLVVDVDERIRPGEVPAVYVRRLAMEKSARALEKICNPAEAGSRFFNDIVVLGADTAVVLDGAIFGKPADNREAAAMLSQLAGRSHEVLTALSLRSHGWERGTVESTTVEFSAIGPEEIEWYARSGEGLDKAGAYAIQGLASRFIPRIHGSYTNVVGLPIAAMHQLVAEIASRPS